MKVIGRSQIEVDDQTRYNYLNPIWELLGNTPNNGITWDEIGKKTRLDPGKAVPLVNELSTIFQKKMTKVLLTGNILNINPELFYIENLENSWLFDKVMLMTMKINTGIENEMWDTNPYMLLWKERWLKLRGM